MKITLKSLKQVAYDIEVDTDEISIMELKKTAESVHGFDHSCLKLVFNGSILDDSKKLSNYNIKDGNVIVMMNAKAKPINVKPSTEVFTNEEKPIENEKKTETTTTEVKPPKDYSNEVTDLVEMGFVKSEAEAAIKAARGNVTIAIEFLYNGIPDNLPMEAETTTGRVTGTSSSGRNTTSDALKKISSMIKMLCGNDPSKLQSVLLGIQNTQPQIIELIKDNEEEFKALINQPIDDDDMRIFHEMNSGMGIGGGNTGSRTGSSGTRTNENNRREIRLNKEEFDAVQRLKEFGFSEYDAVQAYFACEKNEEYALNFLFENKNNQDQDMYINCK